jgi:hypothetical protein
LSRKEVAFYVANATSLRIKTAKNKKLTVAAYFLEEASRQLLAPRLTGGQQVSQF